jgi:hypothetical protein
VQILMLAAGRLLGAGATVQELILPEPFNQLRDAHTDSNRGALVRSCPNTRRRTRSSPPTRGVRWETDVAWPREASGLDVILTLSVRGKAPEGLRTTCEATLSPIWTPLHAPCIAIPVKGRKVWRLRELCA